MRQGGNVGAISCHILIFLDPALSMNGALLRDDVMLLLW
jgi:hypothetical protein